jgi:hypothetical protein
MKNICSFSFVVYYIRETTNFLCNKFIKKKKPFLNSDWNDETISFTKMNFFLETILKQLIQNPKTILCWIIL